MWPLAGGRPPDLFTDPPQRGIPSNVPRAAAPVIGCFPQTPSGSPTQSVGTNYDWQPRPGGGGIVEHALEPVIIPPRLREKNRVLV